MSDYNGINDQGHNRTAEIMISLSVGILAGVAGALLLAPATGREIRGRIGRAANRIADDVNHQARRAGGELSNLATKVEHAVSEGKSAFRQSQDNAKMNDGAKTHDNAKI